MGSVGTVTHRAAASAPCRTRNTQRRSQYPIPPKREMETFARPEERPRRSSWTSSSRKKMEEAEKKRQEMMKAQKEKMGPSGSGNKKKGDSGMGNVADIRREMTKTKEQLEEEKKISLSIRI